MADKATMRATKEALQSIINLDWPEATRLALDMNTKLALPDWPALQEDTVNDPDTGTGQQLKDYLPDWGDKSTAEIMAERGVTEQMVESVKIALEDEGLTLKFPANPKYRDPQWHKVSGGLPADWEERIRKGEPLS